MKTIRERREQREKEEEEKEYLRREKTDLEYDQQERNGKNERDRQG